jgi:Fe-S-cluster-containing hydrogenase component 2
MIFDMVTCGACRTCEIMCSYHHTSTFKPAVSSIKILEKKRGLGYSVLLIEDYDGQSKPCDGCKGEREPLCIEVCTEKKELKKIIEEYLREIALQKKSLGL